MELLLVSLFIGKFIICDIDNKCQLIIDENSPYSADACMESFRNLSVEKEPGIVIFAECSPLSGEEL